jgi:outer membrane protein assembly factor BamE (lipoprotein component of BamABCDE complex)
MNHIGDRRLVSVLLFGCVASIVPPVTFAGRATAFAQSTENGSQAPKEDRSQWRKLQRGMSKDDVKKLIGEPGKVSVAKYYEFWYYGGGNVTFDSKGRLDSWNEP